MGCCLSCLRGYRSIPDHDGIGVVMTDNLLKPFTGYEHFPQPTGALDRGTPVELKYTTKFTYSKKYIWINRRSITINMSKYPSKERSHKEASLVDLTSVIAGPPAIYKPESGEKQNIREGNLCLTINFSKGGGIDIKFSSEEERNLWFVELNNIIMSQGKGLGSAAA